MNSLKQVKISQKTNFLVKNLKFFWKYNNVFLNPSDLEVKNNPASRSAKLRYVTRNQNPFFHPKEFFDKFKNYLDIENLGYE